MTNDITVLQNEIIIEKQKNQIQELKFQLKKLQSQKASRLEDSLFSPELYNHYHDKVAINYAKSDVVPNNYKNKPEDIFVAMAMGYQLGFPIEQCIQDIAVINGRPCLWGDGLLSLCINHPECESIDEQAIKEGDLVIGYACTVKRKNHKAHTVTFTLKDAEKANLLKKAGPWQQYPARMCQLRARSFALRDKFADALRGLRIAEVQQDDMESPNIIDVSVLNEESHHGQTEKLKSMLNPSTLIASTPNEKEPSGTTKTGFVNESISEEDLILADKLKTIKLMMVEKNFDEVRKKRAFGYFKVESVDDLNLEQATLFISQLEKA